MAKRILIVDDEPRYLRLLEANLRRRAMKLSLRRMACRR